MIGNCGKSIVIVSFGAELVSLVYTMRWLMLLAAVLIVADFWFGCSESRKRGMALRWSGAGRRSLNKAVDYVCVLLVGGLLGKAMEPLGCSQVAVTASAVLLACFLDLLSIAGHIAYLHGVTWRFSPKKMLVALIKSKSETAAEAFEEGLDEKINEEKK